MTKELDGEQSKEGNSESGWITQETAPRKKGNRCLYLFIYESPQSLCNSNLSYMQVISSAYSAFQPTLLQEPWDSSQASEMLIGSKNGRFYGGSKWIECVNTW